MPYKDPAVKRAYQAAYYRRHRDRLNEQHRLYVNKRYREDPAFREKVKTAAKKSPLVQRAHNAVYNAIKSGRLVRPDRCSGCNKKGAIEAAHVDYSRPLDVVWLCRSCHRRWDADTPKRKSVA